MNFTIEPMDRGGALEIAGWRYDPPYDFYNSDDSSVGELLDGTYFKILESGLLIGYCCFGRSAIVPAGLPLGAYPETAALDVGLGMTPKLTGNGKGQDFVGAILAFARTAFRATSFRLTVASFNKRAIAVYKKMGFEPGAVFPAAEVEFVTMERRSR